MDTTTNKLVRLKVVDLAFDGKAVAQNEGKVVFLQGGLPGETVLAEITRSRPRYDVGVVREIVAASPARVPAACSHFAACGGCTWQDLTYDQQTAFKEKQVRNCLERIGGLEAVEVEPVAGATVLFRYRNKMEFSFHVDQAGDFTLGLHRRGRYDDIFDLEHCYLQSDLANRIVAWVREYVRRRQIPVYDVKRHHGYMRFLVIRQATRTDQVMVNLVTNYGQFPEPEALVQQMRAELPEVTTLVHNHNGQKSNIAVGETEQILFGPGYIEERLLDRLFRIRANSFFQTNSLQAETLYRTAFAFLEPQRSDRLLDLYCGTGTIGILAAPLVSSVVGVELVGDAVRAARENAMLNAVDNVEFIEGDVSSYLRSHSREDLRCDAVVADPPRAGLHPKALAGLLALQPEKLLYISCNPATFARDAKQLVASGYRLPRVIPVDMFPHTMHIEMVGLFHR